MVLSSFVFLTFLLSFVSHRPCYTYPHPPPLLFLLLIDLETSVVMGPARSVIGKSLHGGTKRKRRTRSPPTLRPRQSKKRPILEDSNDEEENDEDDGSLCSPDDGSSDESSSELPDKEDRTQDSLAVPTTINPGPGSSAREAKDINYFFERGDKKTGRKTICIPCRWVL